MSRKITTIPGDPRRHTLAHQAHIAEAEVFLKTWRLAQPWVAGLLAFGLATLLHFVFGGFGTELMVALAGISLAGFDAHLRASRRHVIARLIGPVSVLATTVGMVWMIAGGFSNLLVKCWLIGGVLLAIKWDIWMMAGHGKDDVRAFGAVADSAGVPGMQFIHRKKSRAERKEAVPVVGLAADGVLQFPPGMTMDDATKALAKLESASGGKRGSWTISPHSDSRQANVRISDPEVLDSEPLLWPGPSAEGASIAVPVRPALAQTGEPLEYSLLNHHALAMGMTGSGKTLTWCYNILAEAITRPDFVCVAADINKRLQFLGVMEPALHHLAVDEDGVLNMLAGLGRISVARSDYMSKMRLTQWQEGCGLSFLDAWLEEAADVLDLVQSQRLFETFKSLVRGFRSRGIRLDMSTQRNDWEEVPTFLRSQLARVCFGVENDDDAIFGLTARQRRLGCTPQDWQTRMPGKFYIDAPTIPETLIAMPMRGWFWGDDSRQMEAYAATWPATDRPMDDVTGEAWEAVPGRSASSAFPVTPKLVKPGTPNLHVVGSEYKPLSVRHKLSGDEAREKLRTQIEDWRCQGRASFARRDIDPMIVGMGYSLSWGQGIIAELETGGVLRKRTDKRPAYWEIIAQADAGEADS